MGHFNLVQKVCKTLTLKSFKIKVWKNLSENSKFLFWEQKNQIKILPIDVYNIQHEHHIQFIIFFNVHDLSQCPELGDSKLKLFSKLQCLKMSYLILWDIDKDHFGWDIHEFIGITCKEVRAGHIVMQVVVSCAHVATQVPACVEIHLG